DLHRSQGRRRVRREVGVARARREHHHVAAIQVADGAPADVRLRDLADLQGGHHPGAHPAALEGVLEREGVDDRGEHAHVVALGPVHALAGSLEPAEDVATPHDQADLDARGLYVRDLLGGGPQGLGVDPSGVLVAQGLTAELEHHPFVPKRTESSVRHGVLRTRAEGGLQWSRALRFAWPRTAGRSNRGASWSGRYVLRRGHRASGHRAALRSWAASGWAASESWASRPCWAGSRSPAPATGTNPRLPRTAGTRRPPRLRRAS